MFSYIIRVLTQPAFLMVSLALLCLSCANYGAQYTYADILNGVGKESNKKEAIVYGTFGTGTRYHTVIK